MKIKLLINIRLIIFLWFFKSFSKASEFRAVIKSNFERTTLVFRDVGNRYTGKSIGEITMAVNVNTNVSAMTAQRYLNN
ncbi:hypothetical protein, partial [Vibrio crassostreae]|uniref:hypothetical protein n=3 Tax=Vibrio TaxID=662 RepID=UPI00202036DD